MSQPLDMSNMTVENRATYSRLCAINSAIRLRYPCDYMDSLDYKDNVKKMKKLKK